MCVTMQYCTASSDQYNWLLGYREHRAAALLVQIQLMVYNRIALGTILHAEEDNAY